MKKTTLVTVLQSGKPSSNRRVSLEFVGGFLPGGFTKDFYTDSSGQAHVEHESEGSVQVYIDGNYSSHETKGRAPGSITVYL